MLRDLNIDYVIRGEGEKPFTALVDGVPGDQIGGLSYRCEHPLQPFRHNPPDGPIQDLDALPTPAYHLVRFEAYKPAIGAYRLLALPDERPTNG